MGKVTSPHGVTPAYSQSLGGEAPGTPQGEAVGQVFKPLGSRPASSLLIAGLPLLFLWASKSDVRHFAPPLNPPRAFKPFPAPLAYSCIAALPCLCVRREPGERASGTCSPCTAAPAPLAYSCIATAALPSYRQQACPPQRLQTLPSAFGLLLQRSLALFLFSAARRPASSLLMGFQKRR